MKNLIWIVIVPLLLSGGCSKEAPSPAEETGMPITVFTGFNGKDTVLIKKKDVIYNITLVDYKRVRFTVTCTVLPDQPDTSLVYFTFILPNGTIMPWMQNSLGNIFGHEKTIAYASDRLSYFGTPNLSLEIATTHTMYVTNVKMEGWY